MQAGTGRKALLLAFLFCASLFVLPTVLAQEDISELQKDSTLDGQPRTRTGEIIGPIYDQIMWLSIAVFLLVAIVLIYILIRFRHRRGEKREVPQIHGNSRLEIAWTIGPALVMVYLLVISYNGLLAIDHPDAEPEFTVQVTAQQFLWTFTYPDGSKAEGGQATLRVQEDTWVRLEVTSLDVIHAFAVRDLDIMIDANPGRINVVQFYAHDPGVYITQCRQFCGVGHGEMLARVEVFEKGTQELPYGRPATAVPPQPQPGNETGNQTDNETQEPVDRTIEVRGFEYGFDPMPLDEIQPGEKIRILFNNGGTQVHNLFVGSFVEGKVACADENDPSTCFRAPQEPDFIVPPGESASFIFTAPAEPIAYDVWCAVSGHATSGMLTHLSVGGAEPAGIPGNEPRLPGPGVALVLVGIFLGAVAWARRR